MEKEPKAVGIFVGNESILVHNMSWCEVRKKAEDALGPGVSELQIRRKMADIVEHYDWQKHIKDNGGVDALGRSKADAEAIGMQTIHGHHVSRKKAIGDEAIEVQNTLLEHGIDPIFGISNLAWAPNKGHPRSNDANVQGLVKNAILESKRLDLTKQQTKSEIEFALKKGAEDFIVSRWPEYEAHRLFK